MAEVNPIIIDRLGYRSAGILSIIGLVVSIWSLYHILSVEFISWMGVVSGYILIAGLFGFVYGDLWLASDRNRELE